MKSNNFSAFKTIIALAIAMMLCLSAALPVFAAGTPIYGTPQAPAQAAITKIFKMPVKTDTPSATFTFTVTKKSANGSTAATDLATMPVLKSQNISYTVSDNGTLNAAGDTKLVIKETPNLFNDITSSNNWPSAGVYEYTIKETPNTYTISDPFKEKMDYSPAEYTLAVYVRDNNGTLYVYAVAAIIEVLDTDSSSAIKDKVDPTPKDPSVSGDYSKMTFTNKYLKNNGKPGDPDPDPDKAPLSVKKIVAGDFASTTQYFNFEVAVSNPSTITATSTTYKAYIMTTAGLVADITPNTTGVSSANIKTDASGHKYIEFTTGVVQTVALKDGQYLSFTDLPVGSSFTVKEIGTALYTPSYVLTINGVSTANPTPPAPVAGDSLAIGKTYIGEALNRAAYTNTYMTVTPTGLSVDDLPYMVIIGLAIASLAAFIVVMYRRRALRSYTQTAEATK